MADAVNYLWWQADTKRESFADTLAATLAAHAVRFGRAATMALVHQAWRRSSERRTLWSRNATPCPWARSWCGR